MFVKICGITTDEDALLSVALGADAIGFNFVPGSRRLVNPDDVRAIVKRLPVEALSVGVFRDERPEQVVAIVNKVGLHAVQLHGREPVTEVRWIRERVQFVIQAFSAGDPAIAAAANSPADVIMLDAPEAGGGRVFDWKLAEAVPGGVRLLLVGGLTPENVADAVARVRPWGVDVATGVESAPGMKDPRKLRRFIEAARATEGEDELVEPNGVIDLDEVAGVDRPWDWQLDQ